MLDGDKMAAQSFRVDDQGRLVFYGMGKARIVPDRATAEAIQNRLKILYFAAMAGVLLLVAGYTIVIDLAWMLGLAVGLCVVLSLAMWLWVRPLIRDLPIAGKQRHLGYSVESAGQGWQAARHRVPLRDSTVPSQGKSTGFGRRKTPPPSTPQE